jgi:hypothetical protein
MYCCAGTPRHLFHVHYYRYWNVYTVPTKSVNTRDLEGAPVLLATTTTTTKTKEEEEEEEKRLARNDNEKEMMYVPFLRRSR